MQGKKILAENVRACRLQRNMSQEGLAKRSGVPLATLRKFEQKGAISLESFLKIQMVLAKLEDILKASQANENANFSSIEDVLKSQKQTKRKRARRKRSS